MKKALFFVILLFSTYINSLAQDYMVGEIKMVVFNYAPDGWLLCDGRELPVNQYQALYSLIGTQYGGNGSTTFRLPDLRGRMPLGYGNGTGLTPRTMGAAGGEESHTLTAAEMPSHTHGMQISSATGTSDTPTNSNYIAKNSEGVKQYSSTASGYGPALSSAGSGTKHNTMPPFVTVNYIICFSGIYPSRPL
ncbi:MAG: phage tail protein [Bacteroidota bacterium]